MEQSNRQIRSQRRQDRRYLDKEEYIDGLTDTTTVYPHEDFADLMIRMDRRNQLYSAIATLSEVQKRRLCLHYFKGMSYRQIGALEGVSFSSVAESVTSAVKKLQRVLGQ